MKKGILLLFLAVKSLLFAVGDDINTKLYHAALFYKVDKARKLLDQGVDVNAVLGSDSALNVVAAEESGYEALKLLISRSVKIDYQDKRGDTALISAASGGQFNSVRLLLDSGANINIVNKHNMSALSKACMLQRHAIINILLQRNAKIHFHGVERGYLAYLINRVVSNRPLLKLT